MKRITDRFKGSYIKPIEDRIQNNALFGIRTFDEDKAIEELKKEGADKFRVIKTKEGFVIICFRLKN